MVRIIQDFNLYGEELENFLNDFDFETLPNIFKEEYEELKKYILSRKEKTVKIFKLKYGENLDIVTDYNLTIQDKITINRIINEFRNGKRYEDYRRPLSNEALNYKLDDLFKEEIEELKKYILSRTSDTVNVFKKKYGENLDNLFDVVLTSHEKTTINRVLYEFKRGNRYSGKTIRAQKEILTDKKLKDLIKGDFEEFKRYVLCLSPAVVNLFKEVYGESLEEFNDIYLPYRKKRLIKTVLDDFNNGKRYGGNMKSLLGLREEFGEKFEEFREYVFSRTQFAIDTYKKKYGENLDEVYDIELMFNERQLISKIKSRFKQGDRKKIKITILDQKLTEIYKEEFEEFKKYILTRTEHTIEVFKKRYGEDFDELFLSDRTNKEDNIIRRVMYEFNKNKLYKNNQNVLEKTQEKNHSKEKKNLKEFKKENNESFLNIYFELYNEKFTSLFTEQDTVLYLLETIFMEERNRIIRGYQTSKDQRPNIKLLINNISKKIVELKSRRDIFTIKSSFLHSFLDLSLDKKDLKNILKNIPEYILNLLYKSYGKNLDKINIDYLTEEERYVLENIIIPYMIIEIQKYCNSINTEKMKKVSERINLMVKDIDEKEEKIETSKERKHCEEVVTKKASVLKFLEEFEKYYKVSFDEYFGDDINYKYLLTNVFNLYVINISLGLTKNIYEELKKLEAKLKELAIQLKEIIIDENLTLGEIFNRYMFSKPGINHYIFIKLSKSMQEIIYKAYGKDFNLNNINLLEEDEKKLLLNIVIPYYIVLLKEEYSKQKRSSNSIHELQERINEYSDISFVTDYAKKYQS